jgi:hypothetical protein
MTQEICDRCNRPRRYRCDANDCGPARAFTMEWHWYGCDTGCVALYIYVLTDDDRQVDQDNLDFGDYGDPIDVGEGRDWLRQHGYPYDLPYKPEQKEEYDRSYPDPYTD